jgi:NAD(P)-dependent dehydrogenase (short-subunit alcohol dehydrogenase family)
MLPAIDRGTPLGRVGTPEDVADVVAFLASDQARWITGQTRYVGGGHRMVQVSRLRATVPAHGVAKSRRLLA